MIFNFNGFHLNAVALMIVSVILLITIALFIHDAASANVHLYRVVNFMTTFTFGRFQSYLFRDFGIARGNFTIHLRI